MSEYISREAVMDALFHEQYGYLCEDAINSIPASDVRPVVHGKWIKPTRVPDSMLDECSVCGFDTGVFTFNYCPNCAADMREKS